MPRTHVFTLALIALALSAGPPGTSAPTGPKLRVGTFDSRALCIAYVHSDLHDELLRDLRRRRDEAHGAGEEALAAELDEHGLALQDRRHRQTFSNAPVFDVLELVEDALPTIAVEAQVDLIVSKWHLVHVGPDVERVDVTELLIAPFEPGERTLKTIAELADHEPLPLYDTDWEAMLKH